jgi:hypothetical protein
MEIFFLFNLKFVNKYSTVTKFNFIDNYIPKVKSIDRAFYVFKFFYAFASIEFT